MNTALVTGTSRGIGLAVAKDLSTDHDVLAAVRDPGRAPSIPRARIVQLDVADPQSIEQCAASVGAPIDVLVNNAAIADGPERRIWDVNVRGPILLVRALLAKLAPRARVVMVSSGMGELSRQDRALARRVVDPALTIDGIIALCDEAPGGYGASKAALNAATRLFARQLPGRLVNAVCPGWVRTDMGGRSAPRSIEQGAASVLWACRLPPDGPTGGFFRDGHPVEF
jgi:NAD(P)-dependent dehydrogenase (short-subunit alcohol dehydrogenase family)